MCFPHLHGHSLGVLQNFSGVRCAALWEVFHPLGAREPLRSCNPFAALISAVIDTVIRNVSVDKDRNLIN